MSNLSNQRISVISSHLNPDSSKSSSSSSTALSLNNTAGKNFKVLESINDDPNNGKDLPRDFQKTLKWNGWGYKDTEFLMENTGDVVVTGSRYLLSGKKLPHFRPWFERFAGLDTAYASPPQKLKDILKHVEKPKLNEPFMEALKREKPFKFVSVDEECRVLHAHGHSCQEIFQLRYGYFKRIPDLVLYPGEHAHVESLMSLVKKFSKEVCLIPYGGGTTVSQSIMCPENETRMVIVVDMQEMNRVKWIDFDSNMACIEAGCNGKDLQEQLSKHGVTIGHEPDSYEFSTVGGWVATRASGMMKNVYGNIEDLLVSAKFVTPMGTMEVGCKVPRKSTGPDMNEIMLGSEGTLGIVTEAVLRIQLVPKKKVYGSIVFPDYESGVAFLHEVSNKGAAPASIRLMDNSQFQFGQALKPYSESFTDTVSEFIKKLYVTKVKGFDEDKLCACTLMFLGQDDEEIKQQENKVYGIASKYGSLKSGEDPGLRGYLLTYVIAYLRDYGFSYYFMAESFETSVPWSNIIPLTNKVKKRICDSAAKKGVKIPPWVSARVTQTYGTGACVYFYFGFIFRGLKDPIKVFSEVEEEARDEILACGGSLSHHHGVGKLRKQWMTEAVGEVGFELLKKIKKDVDPDNILAVANMGVTPSVISVDQQY